MVAGMEGTDLSHQLGNKSGALPFTLLIDRNGKVAKTYLGRLKMEELHTDITKLSSEKSNNTFFLAILHLLAAKCGHLRQIQCDYGWQTSAAERP
jgi:hypothetical protein